LHPPVAAAYRTMFLICSKGGSMYSKLGEVFSGRTRVPAGYAVSHFDHARSGAAPMIRTNPVSQRADRMVASGRATRRARLCNSRRLARHHSATFFAAGRHFNLWLGGRSRRIRATLATKTRNFARNALTSTRGRMSKSRRRSEAVINDSSNFFRMATEAHDSFHRIRKAEKPQAFSRRAIAIPGSKAEKKDLQLLSRWVRGDLMVSSRRMSKGTLRP